MVILTRWFWGSFVIEKLVLKRMGVHLSFHWMCFRWASAECWANKLFEKISYRLHYIVTVRWFGWQPTRNMMTEEAPFRFRSFVYFQGIRWWILHWIPEIKNLPSHSKEFPLHNVFGSKAFLALHNSLDKSQNVSDDKQLDEEDIHLEVNNHKSNLKGEKVSSLISFRREQSSNKYRNQEIYLHFLCQARLHPILLIVLQGGMFA